MADMEDDEQPGTGELPPWMIGAGPSTPEEESDSDRPTIGMRIAGNVPPPSPAPAAAPPMPPVQFDPNKVPASIRPQIQSPSTVPVPPAGANNPNLIDLAKQQAQYGKPLNAADPQYKMGIGTKILGSLGNALSRFGNRNAPVIGVGAGSTNARYARDEAAREGNLQNVNTQIGTQQKLDTENERMYRDAIRQAYEEQVGEARKATGAAQEENAATKATLATTQAALNKARADALDNKTPPEPKTLNEIALALQTARVKGDKDGVAKYSGALEEIRKAKAAERQPKDTSAADIAKALGVAKFRSDEHDKIDKEQDAEREKRYAELDRNVTIKYDQNKMVAAKQKVDQDLETKYAPRHQKADADADQMLGLTKSGTSLKTGATQPSKASSKIDPNNLPKQVMVGGKLRSVAGYNKATKKVILAPEGQ